ncbi:MAG: hypothetical protein E4H47_00375 [Parcubacteria group bacterium]|nr:MAG: hypothetical protein E4H47_00375 [Parcubacteria group bacterium]
MNKKIIIAILIALLGASLRIFLNEKVAIPNFEAVTSISLLAGSFLGGIFGAITSVLMIFFSDIYLGNTQIYLFTWSAFLLVGIVGSLLKNNSKHYVLKASGLGLGSVLFFYLWTNFGWWLISGTYEMSFFGLIRCYIAGLAFLRNQMISVLIFVPVLIPVFSFFSQKIFSRKSEMKTSEQLL